MWLEDAKGNVYKSVSEDYLNIPKERKTNKRILQL